MPDLFYLDSKLQQVRSLPDFLVWLTSFYIIGATLMILINLIISLLLSTKDGSPLLHDMYRSLRLTDKEIEDYSPLVTPSEMLKRGLLWFYYMPAQIMVGIKLAIQLLNYFRK